MQPERDNDGTLFSCLKKNAVKLPQPKVHIRGDLDARYEFVGGVVLVPACWDPEDRFRDRTAAARPDPAAPQGNIGYERGFVRRSLDPDVMAK